ncbi:MAG: DUF86 domain-containing protein [Candidatus Micrarchaeaceae archaeon]
MRKDPKVLLQNMLYSIDRINDMTSGLSFEGFAKNITVQDAVIRRFAIIGEAANALPKDFTAKHKEIEWKKIIGMRNFLVHEYFEIDMRVVWDTIKQDIPKLKTEVTKMLKKNDG